MDMKAMVIRRRTQQLQVVLLVLVSAPIRGLVIIQTIQLQLPQDMVLALQLVLLVLVLGLIRDLEITQAIQLQHPQGRGSGRPILAQHLILMAQHPKQPALTSLIC